MKYAKILGLAAMALAALMAMAGTASATTLTSPSGTTYTSTIVASSTNATLTGPFGTFGSISCAESTVEGKVETHGAAVTAGGKITKLTFNKCTGGTPTTPVAKPGSLQVHSTATTGNGTLTSFSAEVIVHGTILGTCNFTTSSTGTDIGTLTGSNVTKGKAVLDISASIPSNNGCGTGAWHGTYTVNTPSTLEVH